MSLHSSLSPKAIQNRIDRDQRTERPPTRKQVADAFFTARLYHAATCLMSQEAREQIRILTNITEAGRVAYNELY